MLGRPPENPSSTRFTSAGGAGAPPPAMLDRLDVSYLEKLGDSTRSQLWVGTPTNTVTRSRSMSRNAVSASQRYIITRRMPAAKDDSITGMHPVTWKSGTARMKTGGNAGVAANDGSLLGSASGERATSTAARQPKAMSDCTMARWVDTAPLGKPVVPDV